ncbi:MAG TPA: hypothetical protein VK805_17590 [Candidatus Baltobacteraceae bacterium]|nr:hypothetical protein [Candidatus Baltobacteraceae bacterium]
MAGRLIKMLFIIPLAILGMILFAFIGGEIVLHLWNWLMPALFGWHELTFWQALGLLALCRVLFGGFGWHRRRGFRFGGGMGGGRFGRMSPEERDRFRQSVRDYCRQAVRDHVGAEPPAPKPEQP